jgi:hypothetical protein
MHARGRVLFLNLGFSLLSEKKIQIWVFIILVGSVHRNEMKFLHKKFHALRSVI